jgi:N-acetylglutamate synthase-like GNAT family acetyltransferase
MQYIPSRCEQLNQFYKRNKDKARAKPEDLMYAAINAEGEICSVLRLLPYDGFLFLRSVLTAQAYRRSGIASGLITYAIEQQSNLIYTLPTPQALLLYQRLGFKTVPQAEIPAQLFASYRRFRRSNIGPTAMVINTAVR